jgi:hypothetical protein
MTFSSVLSYLGFTAQGFLLDAAAQYTTRSTIADILGVPVSSITIRNVRDAIEGNRRQLADTEISDNTVLITYKVKQTLESMGYSKSTASYAYQELIGELGTAVNNGRYAAMLRVSGSDVFSTSFFENIFDVLGVTFTDYSFDEERKQNIFEENIIIVISLSVTIGFCILVGVFVLWRRRSQKKKDPFAPIYYESKNNYAEKDDDILDKIPDSSNGNSNIENNSQKLKPSSDSSAPVGDLYTMLKSVQMPGKGGQSGGHAGGSGGSGAVAPSPGTKLPPINRAKVYIDDTDESPELAHDEEDVDFQTFALYEGPKQAPVGREPKKSWAESRAHAAPRSKESTAVIDFVDFQHSQELKPHTDISYYNDDFSVGSRHSLMKNTKTVLPPISNYSANGGVKPSPTSPEEASFGEDYSHLSKADRTEMDLMQRERSRLARRRARESLRGADGGTPDSNSRSKYSNSNNDGTSPEHIADHHHHHSSSERSLGDSRSHSRSRDKDGDRSHRSGRGRSPSKGRPERSGGDESPTAGGQEKHEHRSRGDSHRRGAKHKRKRRPRSEVESPGGGLVNTDNDASISPVRLNVDNENGSIGSTSKVSFAKAERFDFTY